MEGYCIDKWFVVCKQGDKLEVVVVVFSWPRTIPVWDPGPVDMEANTLSFTTIALGWTPARRLSSCSRLVSSILTKMTSIMKVVAAARSGVLRGPGWSQEAGRIQWQVLESDRAVQRYRFRYLTDALFCLFKTKCLCCLKSCLGNLGMGGGVQRHHWTSLALIRIRNFIHFLKTSNRVTDMHWTAFITTFHFLNNDIFQ